MFVTLEGIDRAGKSTQAALLAEALGGALLVREPGGTPFGERMRELLKDPGVELDPRTELLLFCAARAELVARVIRPAMEDGRDVICDRFVDSTVAYQGVARGLGADAVDALNAVAVGDSTLAAAMMRAHLASSRARYTAGLKDGGAARAKAAR